MQEFESDGDRKNAIILNSLLNGTVDDWEQLAATLPNFPNGLDNYDSVGRNWITNAIDCAPLECVKWMITKNINLRFVDSEGYTPLHSCIDRTLPHKYEILQLLLNSDADINAGARIEDNNRMTYNSWTPLHMAAARNDLEAIKILLDNGADKTLKTIIDNYCTPEEEAMIFHNKEAAELIRNHRYK
ncbi:MAG: ankyrin repeat domain-containing protein [Tannerellaceae bacterium]|nr:ankyrin repeat domain-containing protein [Tannerellaceae bacterium]